MNVTAAGHPTRSATLDLDDKFRMCAEGVIDGGTQEELLALVRGVDAGADVHRIVTADQRRTGTRYR